MIYERNSWSLCKVTQVKDKLTSAFNEKFFFKRGIIAPCFAFVDKILTELNTISAILTVESNLGIDRLDLLQRISLLTDTETMVDVYLVGVSRTG